MNTLTNVPPVVSLREVRVEDLPVLFEHQCDPEGARMAAFPSRDRAAFMAHWAKIMADPACAIRAVLCDGAVAGQIGAWTGGDERMVGYWIGRAFWSRGVAGDETGSGFGVWGWPKTTSRVRTRSGHSLK